jgi:hypothetical protein
MVVAITDWPLLSATVPVWRCGKAGPPAKGRCSGTNFSFSITNKTKKSQTSVLTVTLS